MQAKQHTRNRLPGIEKMKFDRLKQQFSRFKKDDDGAIMAYIIVTFMLMVLATGMAIDLMRHEIARADIQNALDRAVLAAASRTQQEDREAIFASYMDTRNFHEIDEVTIDYTNFEHSNYRSQVTAVAHYDVPTWFMKLIGITELSAPAASSALEGIGEVEIVLVLDVSLSMNTNDDGSGSRLTHLKAAANTFVDQVMGDDDQAKYTSIAIVPFSTSASLQRVMAEAYAPSTSGTSKMCFRFSNADYGSIPIDTETQYATESSTNDCKRYNHSSVIMPFTNDATRIKDYIDDLSGVYYTSQNEGMKWGLAMIDPSFRDVMQSMVSSVQEDIPASNGKIPVNSYWGSGSGQIRGLVVDDEGNLDVARANSIPRAYGYNSVQKIIVLMTDGHNRFGSNSPVEYTAQYNQNLEYQCDLIHGRTFDTDVFEDNYNDEFNVMNDITPLSGGSTKALVGVKTYTVSLFPPIVELVDTDLIPPAIVAKAPDYDTGNDIEVCQGWGWNRTCNWVDEYAEYDWGGGNGDSLSSVDYDYINYQDKPNDLAVGTFTADDNVIIQGKIQPLYDEMLELLSDDVDEGCASEGYNLVATNSTELEAIFSLIAAEITRLKLVN